MGISSGKFTRELNKEPLLNYCSIYTNGSWSVLLLSTLPYSPCFILMSASFPTQGYHVYFMCSDVIFYTLLLCSRLMTSHHVTCHVTSLSHAFLHCLSQENKIKRKRKVKSKIKEKKIKNYLVSKHLIT